MSPPKAYLLTVGPLASESHHGEVFVPDSESN